MSSVGAYLRQLRETRGVSVEEIARVTRVGSSYLHALEADDFSSLPEPVFTRGFVRAYCQAVGETPDEALALYEGRTEAPSSATPTAPAATTVRPRTVTSHATADMPPRTRGPVLVSFILLVVLGVALFAVTLALQSGRETSDDRRGGGTAVPAPPAASQSRPIDPPASAAPVPAASGGGTATAAVASPSGYRLVARAIQSTWIRVRTEEGRTTEETIPAGQSREWVSARPFTLTVGNAGGIELELNGRALPPLGPSGVVIPRLVVPTEGQ
jgi:cytoskeletal protein RodZ